MQNYFSLSNCIRASDALFVAGGNPPSFFPFSFFSLPLSSLLYPPLSCPFLGSWSRAPSWLNPQLNGVRGCEPLEIFESLVAICRVLVNSGGNFSVP